MYPGNTPFSPLQSRSVFNSPVTSQQYFFNLVNDLCRLSEQYGKDNPVVAAKFSDILKYMIQNKLSPNIKDSLGETFAYKLAKNGLTEFLDALLQKYQIDLLTDSNGKTPLHGLDMVSPTLQAGINQAIIREFTQIMKMYDSGSVHFIYCEQSLVHKLMTLDQLFQKKFLDIPRILDALHVALKQWVIRNPLASSISSGLVKRMEALREKYNNSIPALIPIPGIPTLNNGSRSSFPGPLFDRTHQNNPLPLLPFQSDNSSAILTNISQHFETGIQSYEPGKLAKTLQQLTVYLRNHPESLSQLSMAFEGIMKRNKIHLDDEKIRIINDFFSQISKKPDAVPPTSFNSPFAFKSSPFQSPPFKSPHLKSPMVFPDSPFSVYSTFLNPKTDSPLPSPMNSLTHPVSQPVPGLQTTRIHEMLTFNGSPLSAPSVSAIALPKVRANTMQTFYRIFEEIVALWNKSEEPGHRKIVLDHFVTFLKTNTKYFSDTATTGKPFLHEVIRSGILPFVTAVLQHSDISLLSRDMAGQTAWELCAGLNKEYQTEVQKAVLERFFKDIMLLLGGRDDLALASYLIEFLKTNVSPALPHRINDKGWEELNKRANSNGKKTILSYARQRDVEGLNLMISVCKDQGLTVEEFHRSCMAMNQQVSTEPEFSIGTVPLSLLHTGTGIASNPVTIPGNMPNAEEPGISGGRGPSFHSPALTNADSPIDVPPKNRTKPDPMEILPAPTLSRKELSAYLNGLITEWPPFVEKFIDRAELRNGCLETAITDTEFLRLAGEIAASLNRIPEEALNHPDTFRIIRNLLDKLMAIPGLIITRREYSPEMLHTHLNSCSGRWAPWFIEIERKISRTALTSSSGAPWFTPLSREARFLNTAFQDLIRTQFDGLGETVAQLITSDKPDTNRRLPFFFVYKTDSALPLAHPSDAVYDVYAMKIVITNSVATGFEISQSQSESVKNTPLPIKARISRDNVRQLSRQSDRETPLPILSNDESISTLQKKQKRSLLKHYASFMGEAYTEREVSSIDQWLEEQNLSACRILKIEHAPLNVNALEEVTSHLRELIRAVPAEDMATILAGISTPLKEKLKPHQIEGLIWHTVYRRQFGLNVLFADKMGAGKTIQACSILLHDRAQRKEQTGPYLIICPVNVLANWKKELEKLHSFSEGEIVILHEKSAKTILLKDLAKVTFVITTVETLAGKFRKEPGALIRWAGIAVDEAHRYAADLALAKSAFLLGLTSEASREGKPVLILTGTPIRNQAVEVYHEILLGNHRDVLKTRYVQLDAIWRAFETTDGELRTLIDKLIRNRLQSNALPKTVDKLITLCEFLYTLRLYADTFWLRRKQADWGESATVRPQKDAHTITIPLSEAQLGRIDEIESTLTTKGAKRKVIATIPDHMSNLFHPLAKEIARAREQDGDTSFIQFMDRFLLERSLTIDAFAAQSLILTRTVELLRTHGNQKGLVFVHEHIEGEILRYVVQKQVKHFAKIIPDFLNGDTPIDHRLDIMNRFNGTISADILLKQTGLKNKEKKERALRIFSVLLKILCDKGFLTDQQNGVYKIETEKAQDDMAMLNLLAPATEDTQLRNMVLAFIQQSLGTRLFIGTVDACSEGIALYGDYVIFLSKLWTGAKNKQAEFRAVRPGGKQTVAVYDFELDASQVTKGRINIALRLNIVLSYKRLIEKMLVGSTPPTIQDIVSTFVRLQLIDWNDALLRGDYGRTSKRRKTPSEPPVAMGPEELEKQTRELSSSILDALHQTMRQRIHRSSSGVSLPVWHVAEQDFAGLLPLSAEESVKLFKELTDLHVLNEKGQILVPPYRLGEISAPDSSRYPLFSRHRDQVCRWLMICSGMPRTILDTAQELKEKKLSLRRLVREGGLPERKPDRAKGLPPDISMDFLPGDFPPGDFPPGFDLFFPYPFEDYDSENGKYNCLDTSGTGNCSIDALMGEDLNGVITDFGGMHRRQFYEALGMVASLQELEVQQRGPELAHQVRIVLQELLDERRAMERSQLLVTLQKIVLETRSALAGCREMQQESRKVLLDALGALPLSNEIRAEIDPRFQFKSQKDFFSENLDIILKRPEILQQEGILPAYRQLVTALEEETRIIDGFVSNPLVFQAYIAYMTNPGEWLLTEELKVAAAYFGRTIQFYTKSEPEGPEMKRKIRFIETINPGQPVEVTICYNGYNHFERMSVDGIHIRNHTSTTNQETRLATPPLPAKKRPAESRPKGVFQYSDWKTAITGTLQTIYERFQRNEAFIGKILSQGRAYLLPVPNDSEKSFYYALNSAYVIATGQLSEAQFARLTEEFHRDGQLPHSFFIAQDTPENLETGIRDILAQLHPPRNQSRVGALLGELVRLGQEHYTFDNIARRLGIRLILEEPKDVASQVYGDQNSKMTIVIIKIRDGNGKSFHYPLLMLPETSGPAARPDKKLKVSRGKELDFTVKA